MADSKISSLTETTTIQNTDEYAVVQGTETKKVKAQNVLPDGSVTTAKLADDAVTSAKIADDAVNATKIADDAIYTTNIADEQVTTAKLDDDAVTNAKLADDAVQEENIKDGEATKSLYGLLSTQTQSSTTADDKLDEQAVKAGYLSKNGDRIRAFAEFEQNLATAGTGKMKIIDNYDDSVKATFTTESLDDQSEGIIELELIRISDTQLRYFVRKYYFSQEVQEDNANNGHVIERGTITVNSLTSEDITIAIYGNSTVANNVYCHTFWVDIVKMSNSRYIPA